MKPLYALVAQCRDLELMETDTDLGPETLEAITNTLDGIKCEIQVKAQGVGAFILNLEAYSQAAKEASVALSVRAKRIQARADHLREYLRVNMEALDSKKIETETFTLTRKANPPAVIIADGATVPSEYLKPRDPLVDRIVEGARQRSDSWVDGEPLLLTPDELAKVIEACLPARDPDKRKIGEALKAHAHLVAAAEAAKQPLPDPILPGCSLQQGERLEIKP